MKSLLLLPLAAALSMLLSASLPTLCLAFPLGQPPVENAVTSRVAPQNTTFYVCWNESGTPDANSQNKTEQMLADKRLVPFFDQVRASLYQSTEKIPPMASAVLNWGSRKSVCVYLDADGEGGALACLGADADAARKEILASMWEEQKAGTIKAEMIKISKLKFCKITDVKTGDLKMIWGFLGKKKEYLLISKTEDGIKTILKNVTTPAPQWLTDLRNSFEVKSWSTFSYIDTNKYLTEVVEQGTGETRKYLDLTFKMFGFDSMQSLAAISGMTDEGVIQKAVLTMKDEWNESLPGILFEGKLTEEDLNMVPADVTFAMIGKTNINKLFNHIMKTLQETEGVLPPESAGFVGMAGMVVTPLLQPLGDTWSVFTLPGTSEKQINGCLVFSLKNPAMAKLMIPKLLDSMKKPAGGMGDGMGDASDESGSGDSDDSDGSDGSGESVVPGIPSGIQLPPGVTPEMIKEQLKKKGIDPSQIPPGTIPGFGMSDPESSNASDGLILRGQNLPGMGVMPANGAAAGGMGMGAAGGLGGGFSPMDAMSAFSVEDVEMAGVKGWKFVLGDPATSPVLAIVRNVLVLAFNETSLEQYINYDGSKSLASVEVVSREIGKYPSYIVHEDSAVMVKAVLPTLAQFVKDPAALPSEEVLEKYLGRFSGVGYVRDNKIYIQSEHTFPLPDYVLEFAGSILFGSTQQNALTGLSQDEDAAAVFDDADAGNADEKDAAAEENGEEE